MSDLAALAKRQNSWLTAYSSLVKYIIYLHFIVYINYVSISGAPIGSVPQNICSYGISGRLARKRNR